VVEARRRFLLQASRQFSRRLRRHRQQVFLVSWPRHRQQQRVHIALV
jgi:hypothetical protein